MLSVICFFFSSRRRHTRWNCDWSSDVCSSDLSPAGDGYHFQDWNVRAMRFDEGDVRGRGVGLDNDWLEFREILCIGELIPQIIQADSQTVRDAREMLFHQSRIITKEEHAERRPIVHENAAIAVQHAAARRNYGNVAHTIALSQRAIPVGVDDLELPEADQQDADHSHDDV